MDGFLKHVTSGTNYATGDTGTPLDFLSFHAKGQPTFVDGHVRMGIATHLKAVDAGFTKVLSLPALARKPVVIGESDPEGCAACPGPQNAYRNGTLYSSYTAASFARIWELAAKRGVNLEGVLSWSFEFENQPWFAGYRQLATNGVDLPVLNVFRLFAQLGTERLTATSSAQVPLETLMSDGVRGGADVGALATRRAGGEIAVLVWNYHDDDVPGPDAAVHVDVRALRIRPGTSLRDPEIPRGHQDAERTALSGSRRSQGSTDSLAWQRGSSPQCEERNTRRSRAFSAASRRAPARPRRCTPGRFRTTARIALSSSSRTTTSGVASGPIRYTCTCSPANRS
jgi:xylan 1,4-beta-xylosidase